MQQDQGGSVRLLLRLGAVSWYSPSAFTLVLLRRSHCQQSLYLSRCSHTTHVRDFPIKATREQYTKLHLTYKDQPTLLRYIHTGRYSTRGRLSTKPSIRRV